MRKNGTIVIAKEEHNQSRWRDTFTEMRDQLFRNNRVYYIRPIQYSGFL
ncbi:MAG TPA: hypothetical protein VKA08_16480 [Balneolales bacterium]|nr:hypothetical protein [Balneolales bacterium]